MIISNFNFLNLDWQTKKKLHDEVRDSPQKKEKAFTSIILITFPSCFV